MRAWAVEHPGPVTSGPLVAVERPLPEPGPREIRVRVSVCGVCRTDLHLAEGDLAPRRPGVVPGHEVVGVVDALGPGASRFRAGQRVGIAWLRHTCSSCRFCLSGRENLCTNPKFTGWDEDGGYAEAALVHESYAYEIPGSFSDEEAAPLLCAGIIGYRALRLTHLPAGGRLGVYGFGASAHITAQVALREGAEVHVITRSEAGRRLALDLGASSAGGPQDDPPARLDGAILFAPAGHLVPRALRALDRGATLSIAGIYLSDIPALSYESDLFFERRITSVTANTRRDGEELLALASRMRVRVTSPRYRLDEADRALADLAAGSFEGAAVLVA